MVGSLVGTLMRATSRIRSTICAVGVLTAISVDGQPRPEPSGARMFVIRSATVIDGTGAQPRVNFDLLVADGRISAMGPGLTAPPGTIEMNAKGAWVVPGLIDVHVHLDTPMVFQVSDE